MSFGSNVVFYRKRKGITQEELAEELEVTRQTISRWETDTAFPDMGKLIALCDLFGCDMETLVRGDAEQKNFHDSKEELRLYDRHMNIFSALITAGVVMVIAGVAGLLFLNAFGIKEAIGVVLFFAFITVATAIFVAGGIWHDNFIKENPRISQYPPERIRLFRKKLPFLYSGATALILAGVITIVAMTYDESSFPALFSSHEHYEYFSAAIFMCFVATAVGIFVGTGMLSGKYDIKSYNRARKPKEKESRAEKGNRIADSVCGVIMMTATAIYLVVGFIWKLWHPGWVVFPVGGILCGIISSVFKAIYGDVNDEAEGKEEEKNGNKDAEKGNEKD